jgi:hypothetical protein
MDVTWIPPQSLVVMLRFFAGFICLVGAAAAHPSGPEPLLSYDFNRESIDGELLKPRFGPALKLGGAPLDEPAAKPGLRFASIPTGHVAEADAATLAKSLPKRDFTVAAWFSIDAPRDFGAIFSSHEDNGNAERGLVVGYDKSRPSVSLATKGTDDDNGRMVNLRGSKPWKTGQLHQVVVTYDGSTLTLYLDGEVVSTSKEASGDIDWPEVRRICIGGYLDQDENFPHDGRIVSVRVYDVCATAEWVAHDLEHGEDLLRQPVDEPAPVVPALVVEPYLQWITTNEATIRWETNFPCVGQVRWGLDHQVDLIAAESGPCTHHEVKLTGLEPEMLYFYQTLSVADGERVLASRRGTTLESPVSTLQTANRPDTPFGFVVLSDVQRGGNVPETLAKAAWELRPNFTVIPGDLVDNGNSKSQWTDEFFAPLKTLNERVPFYPVLGNHDLDSRHFYDYVSLPDPEYCYTFTFGNTQFFMLDTNRDVRPGTAQYLWLDRELAASKARWKICVHHQPPFSSDDDYGNDWKRPIREATFGDMKSKPLVELYDKYAVDIVWCGHIHSYERTWLLRGGKPVELDGTLYMITGGGGGPLERHGPFRPGFQRNIRRGHHFCYVAVNGGQLEIQAYDLEGRLFDSVKLQKQDNPPAR